MQNNRGSLRLMVYHQELPNIYILSKINNNTKIFPVSVEIILVLILLQSNILLQSFPFFFFFYLSFYRLVKYLYFDALDFLQCSCRFLYIHLFLSFLFLSPLHLSPPISISIFSSFLCLTLFTTIFIEISSHDTKMLQIHSIQEMCRDQYLRVSILLLACKP